VDNENPYAAPTALSTFQPIITDRPVGIRVASQGARFANFVVDRIVVFALASVGGFLFGVVYGITRASPTAPLTPQESQLLDIFGWVVAIGAQLLYYIVMELAFQRTLGKLLSGTKVVTEKGEPPSFGQILGRTLARFIPFEAFSFFGGGGKPVGWHDSLSGTRVVSSR
jgi:uncharacterized RDD family membrane protein YckC